MQRIYVFGQSDDPTLDRAKLLKSRGAARDNAGTTVSATMNEAAVPVAVTKARDRAMESPAPESSNNGKAPATLVPLVAASDPRRALVIR